ncbi:endonuclease/exonuclease/phosphatase family protein [Thiorhodococcus minor]|uniref:Endonuclease n=1 Tax=Thiorhodococcus minor TaxID=57489 RepID=A0A6M0JV13_9GAMM|nr:endonuclease/exonuclease/phosphatase family protein [Thiorhodococcus minor]NEV61382.1 endonuclease [Thiorhodococcus minor]
MTEATRISVATYNIHRGVGRDGRMDHQRVAGVILDLDADIVALQEVETPASVAPGAVALMHRLAQQGYEPVLGPTMWSERGSYGNALLSRLPVRRHRRHDLSHPGREPRGLIEATLRLKPPGRHWRLPSQGREIRCFATHLGLRASERSAQIRKLDSLLARAAGVSPTLLMGDFNEWRRRAGRLKQLHARLQPAPTRSTYPGFWPLFPLDRIWLGGGLDLEAVEVVRAGLARVASDHLPLRAVLRLVAMQ